MMNTARNSNRVELRLGLRNLSSRDLSSLDKNEGGKDDFFTPAEVQLDENSGIARNESNSDEGSSSELESLTPIEALEDIDDHLSDGEASFSKEPAAVFVRDDEEQHALTHPGRSGNLDDVAIAVVGDGSDVPPPVSGIEAVKTRFSDVEAIENQDEKISTSPSEAKGPNRGSTPSIEKVRTSSSDDSSIRPLKKATRRQRTYSSAGGQVLFSPGTATNDELDIEAADATGARYTMPVEEPSSVQTPRGSPGAVSSVDAESGAKETKFLNAMAGAGCLMLILVIVVAVVLARSGDASETSPPSPAPGNPTATPTMAPVTPSPTPDNFDQTLKFFTDYSGEEALSDPSSPQFKAALWSTNEDVLGNAGDPTQKLARYFVACLYFATNGDASWTRCSRNDGTSCAGTDMGGPWLAGDTNECDWFGVSCNDGGKVNKISFDVGPDEQMGLKGELPLELSFLTELTMLSLARNQLFGALPTFLGELKALEQLRLSENNLKGTIPAELQKLSFLKWLALDGNELTGTIPSFVGQYEHMTDCYLQNNQLVGKVPPFLLHIGSALDLSSNKLTGFDDGPTWDDTKLDSLKASSNQFDETVWSQIVKSKGLTVLQLDENPELGGGLPADLFSLTLLTSLDLSGCSITGTIPVTISQLTALEELSLDNNKLDGPIPVDSLDRIAPSLRKLELHENDLTGQISSGTKLCERRGDNDSTDISVLTTDCDEGVACDCCSACF